MYNCMITERTLFIAHLLPGFMTLACNHDHITGDSCIECRLDSLCAIIDHLRFHRHVHAGYHIANDGCLGFMTRVIAGDNDTVGQTLCNAPH